MDLMEHRLDKLVESESQRVDLQDLFFRFTLDGFAKIGFNTKLNCMTLEEPVPFAVAFDRSQSILDFRFIHPYWKFTELFRYFAIQKDFKTIKTFCSDVVKERKKDLNFQGNDLLSLFMGMKDENGESLYNDTQLGEFVLNFIIAGRDTTAQALSWTFYELALHPEVELELVKEIQTTLGVVKQDRPTYDLIKEMKYAKAVFFETLRLHPSVPKNMKHAVHDDVLPDGTFIPAGFKIAWSTYAQGRSKEIWGPDAEEFRPSRWLNMESQPNPSKYSVFHAGPRTCLGKTMAEIEGVYVLTSILNKFNVTVIDPENVTYARSVTLPMVNGLPVKVTKRS